MNGEGPRCSLLQHTSRFTQIQRMSLARLRQLTEVQQRQAACMLGALVADSAGEWGALTCDPLPPSLPSPPVAPLHWIYDQDKVAGLVAAGTAEFSPTSHCPYYTIPAGEVSPVRLRMLMRVELYFVPFYNYSPVPMVFSCKSPWRALLLTVVSSEILFLHHSLYITIIPLL